MFVIYLRTIYVKRDTKPVTRCYVSLSDVRPNMGFAFNDWSEYRLTAKAFGICPHRNCSHQLTGGYSERSVTSHANKQNKLHGLSPRANYTDRRLSAKLVPNFADRACHVVSVTSPTAVFSDF
jgi:hypothetical protein